jgi:hypothetical protein
MTRELSAFCVAATDIKKYRIEGQHPDAQTEARKPFCIDEVIASLV